MADTSEVEAALDEVAAETVDDPKFMVVPWRGTDWQVPLPIGSWRIRFQVYSSRGLAHAALTAILGEEQILPFVSVLVNDDDDLNEFVGLIFRGGLGEPQA